MTTVVEEFVGRYRREQDFYEQAARLVAQSIELRLQAEGLRAIVTYRAKNAGRLLTKVQDRDKTKNYPTVDSIYDDLVDLAGVRVALYFPGQSDQVGRLVEDLFVLTKRKSFPSHTAHKYTKRFSGYSATHYHVRLRDSILGDSQKKYGDARVEIQVASVLMHAWAEVEHDLVYKPLQGSLSIDEYAVLDELNGMVLAGELALERLQRAGEQRVAEVSRTLANHYELATHLLHEVSKSAPQPLAHEALGHVDLLFGLLLQLDMARPSALEPYLHSLHSDFENRPIAEQIIDRLLSEEPARYATFEKLQLARRSDGIQIERQAQSEDAYAAMGRFIAEWNRLEMLFRLQTLASTTSQNRRVVIPTTRVLEQIAPTLAPETLHEFDRLRRARNVLVHGVAEPNAVELDTNTQSLHELRQHIERALVERPSPARLGPPTPSHRTVNGASNSDLSSVIVDKDLAKP